MTLKTESAHQSPIQEWIFGRERANFDQMSDETTDLYNHIGGADGVLKLVDAFYAKVSADPDLAPFFTETSMEKLKRIQQEFITQALGGPLKYSGRPLTEVHHGRGIQRRHFQKWVDHFLDTLGGFDLTSAEIDEIISRVVVDVDAITGGAATGG